MFVSLTESLLASLIEIDFDKPIKDNYWSDFNGMHTTLLIPIKTNRQLWDYVDSYFHVDMDINIFMEVDDYYSIVFYALRSDNTVIVEIPLYLHECDVVVKILNRQLQDKMNSSIDELIAKASSRNLVWTITSETPQEDDANV